MSDGEEAFTHPKQVICVHATEDAIKVTPIHPHKPIPFWVPQACVHADSEVYKKGDEGKLVVKMFWAEKEKWV